MMHTNPVAHSYIREMEELIVCVLCDWKPAQNSNPLMTSQATRGTPFKMCWRWTTGWLPMDKNLVGNHCTR